MHLRELQLTNFKSFAGRQRIRFHPGYTGITGPNGAGKSNVADAIHFVLGPLSSKRVRAETIPDLIHHGDRTRHGARSMEVTLNFADPEQRFGQGTMVAFTRRIKLTPGKSQGFSSSFLLDGERTTQEHLQTILAQAGFHPDAYPLVRQGDVHRLMELGDRERAERIEHVAGIREFDERIRKARLEQEAARTDLDRCRILLSEKAGAREKLATEREAALEYRELQERIARITHHTEVIAWREKGLELASLHDEHGSLSSGLPALIATWEVLADEEVEKATSLASEDGATGLPLDEGSLRHAEIAVARAEAAKVQVDSMVSQVQQRLITGKGPVMADREELERVTLDLAGEPEGGTLESIEAGPEPEELAEEVRHLRDELGSVTEALAEVKANLAAGAARTQEKAGQLDAAQRDLAEHEETGRRLKVEQRDLVGQQNRAIRELEQATSQVERHQARIAELAVLVDHHQSQVDEVESESHLAERTLVAARVRAEVLADGAAPVGLDPRDLPPDLRRLVVGTFAGLLELDRVPKGILRVITPRLDDWVVQDAKAALVLANHLRKQGETPITLVPKDAYRYERPDGSILLASRDGVDLAIDDLPMPDPFSHLAWHLVADALWTTADEGRRKDLRDLHRIERSGLRIRGEGVVEVPGPIAAGLGNTDVTTQHLPEGDLPVAEAEVARIGGILSGRQAALVTQAKTHFDAGEELLDLQDEVITRERTVAALGHRRASIEERLAEIIVGVESRSARIDDLEAEVVMISGTEPASSDLEQQRERLHSRLEDAQAREATARAARDTMLEQASAREAERMARHELVVHRRTLTVRIAETDQDRLDLEVELQALLTTQENAGSTLIAALTERDQAVTELDAARSSTQEARVVRDQAIASLQDLRHRLDTAKEAIEASRTRLQEQAAAISALTIVINDLAALLPAEVRAKAPNDLDPMQLEREARRLREARERLGAVNLKSISDYASVEDEYTGLADRVKDLRGEDRRLTKLIKECADLKRVRFDEAFAHIEVAFATIYARLVPGGTALLRRDGDAGVIIEVTPPGKKVIRLDALSGGEKSLGAMAFLFALYSHRSPPMLVLDEVDMFLDTNNTETLAREIALQATSLQVLQISLRQATLRYARHLIGITMAPESGRSEVFFQVGEGIAPGRMDGQSLALAAGPAGFSQPPQMTLIPDVAEALGTADDPLENSPLSEAPTEADPTTVHIEPDTMAILTLETIPSKPPGKRSGKGSTKSPGKHPGKGSTKSPVKQRGKGTTKSPAKRSDKGTIKSLDQWAEKIPKRPSKRSSARSTKGSAKRSTKRPSARSTKGSPSRSARRGRK